MSLPFGRNVSRILGSFLIALSASSLAGAAPAPPPAPSTVAPPRTAPTFSVVTSMGLTDDVERATTGRRSTSGGATVPGAIQLRMGYGLEYATVTGQLSAESYSSGPQIVDVNGQKATSMTGTLSGEGAVRLYDAMTAVATQKLPPTPSVNGVTTRRASPQGRVTCVRLTPMPGSTTGTTPSTHCTITGIVGFFAEVP